LLFASCPGSAQPGLSGRSSSGTVAVKSEGVSQASQSLCQIDNAEGGKVVQEDEAIWREAFCERAAEGQYC